MESAKKLSLTSCIVMTCGLCLHFFGYECARAASISLLAAKDVGLGNEALPLTIALGTPISGLVLYLYTKSIKSNGSRVTLRISNILCIIVLGIVYHSCCSEIKGLSGKFLIIAFYAFREIYVSLLSTQQWAFIATSLDKTTSGYIVSFSGVVSVASALGGFAVEQLVLKGGIRYLLLSCCFCAVASGVLSDTAFSLRPNANVMVGTSHPTSAPSESAPKRGGENHATSIGHDDSAGRAVEGAAVKRKRSGFLWDSWCLICKHHILQILLVEGVVHQLCTNMLNLMFLNGLRKEVAQDTVRAMLVGRFFATVNIVVCGLQIFVLPHVLSQASLPKVLTRIPMIVMFATLLGVVRPGIISVMLGFGVIKVLEYSVMTAASEMIYVEMGHEVRYLGKELIRYFGHKLGKSAASLVLSGLVAQFDPSLATQSLWGSGLALCWGYAMYRLANHLWERNRNEDGFAVFKTAASCPDLSTAQESISEPLHGSDTLDGDDIVLLSPRSSNASVFSADRPTSAARNRSRTASRDVNRHLSSETTGDCTTSLHFGRLDVNAVPVAGVLPGCAERPRSTSWDFVHSVDSQDRMDESQDPDPTSGDTEKDTEEEDEEVELHGYGYEADAAWKKMYGGDESPADPVEPRHAAHRADDFPVENTAAANSARRRNSSAAMHRRTLSDAAQEVDYVEQEDSVSGVSRRVKTMSFDGELENSRPIMLRVGSMHVSLNTLEQVSTIRATIRAKQKK